MNQNQARKLAASGNLGNLSANERKALRKAGFGHCLESADRKQQERQQRNRQGVQASWNTIS